jgi:hypothetical protein
MEGLAQVDQADHCVRAFDIQHAAAHVRVGSDDADRVAVEPCQRGHDRTAITG